MATSLPVRVRAGPLAARACLALGAAVLALGAAPLSTLSAKPGKGKAVGQQDAPAVPVAPAPLQQQGSAPGPGPGNGKSKVDKPGKGLDKPGKGKGRPGGSNVVGDAPSSQPPPTRPPSGTTEAPAASSNVGATAVPVAAQPPARTTPAVTRRRTPASGGRPPATRRRAVARRRAALRRARAARGGGSSGEASVPRPDAAEAADAGAALGTEGQDPPRREDGSPVARTVRDIVEVVPGWAKAALAALAALCAMLAGGWILGARRARRLARQRGDLLHEVGVLQSALLPPVPETLGAVKTSVAYRPAEGLAAGGDFYDALSLPGGRSAFILGDVSGHGQEALDRTAFVRYTVRAYVQAGLEPRAALQVAGRVIGDHLGGDFVTVVIATHDPVTGSLTYAAAGHPAPIVVGPKPFEPVLAASSPPIGIGVPTGLRQTSVPFPAGAVGCLYTDGLPEARTADGGILGRGRLGDIVAELGPGATARELLDRISAEASTVGDDMAACLLVPTEDAIAERRRVEELEVSAPDLATPMVGRFLEACGVSGLGVDTAEAEARHAAERYGGALLHVVLDGEPEVEVFPRDVESILAASRRVLAE